MGASLADVVASNLDPYAPETLADPFPHLARVRETAAVVWLSRYEIYAATRHREVDQALRDWEAFSSASGVGLSDFRREPPWRPPSLLLEADPPSHTRARTVVNRALTPKILADLKESFAARAEEIAEVVVARRRFDAVRDVAQAYPLRVFPDALGLDDSGRENLLRYGDMAFNAFGPRNELLDRSLRNAAPVQGWIADHCRRAALAPDGLGSIIYAAADAGEITEEEAALLVRSFLTAGVDTTVNGLAAALLHLSRDPAQWRALHEDPSLARNAFEEAVRFESPVQTFFRTTARPIELGGVRIPEGRKILLLLASANRDPRKWERPDEFDIRRKTAGHVGFGAGIHGCVGQMIARMEGELMLAALARRARELTALGEPRRRLNNTLRTLTELPVEIAPAGSS